ncbi:cyclic AMP response element-binding protein A isoform X2 [Anopheles maculipalpis]|uniref:cyclic AMP response element-binding protein A isoform X2 n=1 Tax=Anopheles maculipalpis TaxID=1496333 RepID=UPI0021595830|nr:cyclic AMP response element-binding protein A isoform X2 [Anopheles maculipalpis]
MDFDDGDLKDIWDTDLDANLQDTLKMSNYPDIQDWMDPNSKLPPVILNDKLMTDAIIGTCMPIKTEHSYSLNSDGDSLPDTIPDSPHSLQNKMDDMDEECYPAISMNGSSKHQHIIHRQNHANSLLANGQTRDSKPTFAGMSLLANGGGLSNAGQQQNAQMPTNGGFSTSNGSLLSNNNNNHLVVNNNLNLKDSIAGMKELAGFGSTSSCHDSSSSTSASIASDIDIDETTVKEEPLSPSSSCPPSPIGSGCGGGGGSEGGGGSLHSNFGVSSATLGAYAHTDLVLEHKNGSLQLSSASQSLLKNQQIMIATSIPQQSSTTQQQQQKLVMSKLNIKMEPQSSGFGLPPTPPSSLPSDESEGNQSPEHHVSPMSPPTDIGSTSSGANSTTSSRRTSLHASSSITSGAGSMIGSTAGGQSATTTSRQASGASHHSSSAGSSPSASQSTTSSTRQPIHTPLISSQPKGSTGTLILTEEEKRTLLAEGYPIPTRLPLTKAEEKSLKKIRRKIKNKISAQESRRKKKEYMDQLERRVEILMSENLDYRKRVETLEDCNQNLQTELSKLRQLITRQGTRKAS